MMSHGQKKFLASRCILSLAIVFIAPSITSCVDANAPEPVAPVAAAATPAPAPIVSTGMAPAPTPSPAPAAVSQVAAIATITAGGGLSKSNAIAVFASIGETGNPPIQTSGNLLKVSGVGSIVFGGTSSD